jgi:glycosyltransferase involved in cell wall biosynthesis
MLLPKESQILRSPTAVPQGATTLAVLCPVYNEQDAIPLFLKRMMNIFAQLGAHYAPSLYFIDNGCTDASMSIIRSFHQSHPNVFAIVMSRNFGYQSALEAGLRTVTANLYVMIDVDCEDPPEMIMDFLRHYEEGFEIVYGERADRPEPPILKGLRKLYYRIVRWLADDNFVLNMAEFSLITAEVRNAILQDASSTPFLRASIGRIGFRRKNLPYRRHSRIAGKTHYNFVSLTLFGIVGILSSSTVVLRAPAYVLPFWALAMTGIAILATVSPGGWQIPALLLLGFGYLGFSVAFNGLYIARVYKNGLQRPNAIVRYGLSILPPESPEE